VHAWQGPSTVNDKTRLTPPKQAVVTTDNCLF